MPELVAHREPATLPRHPVLQQNDSAAPRAVGQKTALEAFGRQGLDFDDVEPAAARNAIGFDPRFKGGTVKPGTLSR